MRSQLIGFLGACVSFGCGVSLERGDAPGAGGGQATTAVTSTGSSGSVTSVSATSTGGGDSAGGASATSVGGGGPGGGGDGAGGASGTSVGGGGPGGGAASSSSGGPCGGLDEPCCANDTCNEARYACDADTGTCRGCVESLVSGEASTGACARTKDGRTLCWGSNQPNWLVCGGVGAYFEPRAPEGLGSARVVDVGYHTCAIGPGDSVLCAGENGVGECGTAAGSEVCPLDAVPLRAAAADVEVTSRGSTFALTTGGEVYGWGDNSDGQLGLATGPDDEDHPVPELVAPFGNDNIGIAASSVVTCALKADRTVRCLGNNQDFAAGTEEDPLPVGVLGIPDVQNVDELSAGAFFFCARSGAQVRCWGNNSLGELGSDAPSSAEPLLVPLPSAARRVSAGNSHACAVLTDDSVYCWGWNQFRQVGRCSGGTHDPVQVFLDVDLTVPLFARDISAGGLTTCAIDRDDEVICWGDNRFFQAAQEDFEATACPPRRVDLICSEN